MVPLFAVAASSTWSHQRIDAAAAPALCVGQPDARECTLLPPHGGPANAACCAAAAGAQPGRRWQPGALDPGGNRTQGWWLFLAERCTNSALPTHVPEPIASAPVSTAALRAAMPGFTVLLSRALAWTDNKAPSVALSYSCVRTNSGMRTSGKK